MNPKEFLTLIEQLNKRILTLELKINQMQIAITSMSAEIDAIELVLAELQ
ncbi:MAG: hypothetical protein PHE93_00795 [Clostridia bacterium]|nr:hypothetical protein [Clostridia bacterium]